MAFNYSVKGGLLITIQNVDEILLAIEFLIIKVFDILVGLLKRDTRAPHPFIIVIDNTNAIDGDLSDYGSTISPARSWRLGAGRLANVQFAVCRAVFSDTVLGAKLIQDRLETKFVTSNLTDGVNNLLSNIGNQSKHVPDYSITLFLIMSVTYNFCW